MLLFVLFHRQLRCPTSWSIVDSSLVQRQATPVIPTPASFPGVFIKHVPEQRTATLLEPLTREAIRELCPYPVPRPNLQPKPWHML